ncbi:MAG: peptidase C39 [Lachnospiraceae bacterium]|nr:peptidase C39 [Lachnospiraceae bacterium]
MKNPLHYQISEYDCGPTTMLNAISFLFQREEIPPAVIRNIMLYCLDCYNNEGIMGKNGTSRAAMMFLCNWLNEFGKIGQLPVSGSYLSGESVWVGKESLIYDALCRGGVVIVRVFFECDHYVLLTGIKEEKILMFDPYYVEEKFPEQGIVQVKDQPFWYNRIINEEYFNRESTELYALGPTKDREAILIFNEKTKKTAEQTIEYFI